MNRLPFSEPLSLLSWVVKILTLALAYGLTEWVVVVIRETKE